MSEIFARKWRWPILLVLLWMTSLLGIQTTPLENHEVFVLQTTREMQARQDWVLPSFNDQWRLQKPPLNYWATAAVAKLDPFNKDIEPWHGRLVSLLASLGLLLATYAAGRRMYGELTGKLASLSLAAMQGYLNLANSARPDFLYSALSVLQLYAWIHAWQSEDGTRSQRYLAWAGWALAGLATLTKGPQAPVVLLAGLLACWLAGPGRRRVLTVLRPFTGLPISLALVLPWWILLQRRLETVRVDLSDTQLSGSLLANLASWKELFSGFYLFSLIGLMLPAILLVPFLAAWAWRNRRAMEETTRTLLGVGAMYLMVFTVGGHYRKHYLIPLLPLGALLLARALDQADAEAWKGWKKILVAVILGGLGLLGAGLMIRGGAYGALVLVASCILLGGWLVRLTIRDEAWPGDRLAAQWASALVILGGITVSILGFLPSPTESWRKETQAFAVSAGKELQPEDQMLQWKVDLPILPYMAKRPVPVVGSLEEVQEAWRQKPASSHLYVVLPKRKVRKLKKRFQVEVTQRLLNPREPGKSRALVRIVSEK